MKIKLLLPFLFFFSSLTAQIWFEENATWSKPFFSPSLGHGITEIVVAGTDTIKGIEVKKLTSQGKYQFNNEIRELPAFSLYMYESNDSVFYWNRDTFELVYNFNLEEGDTVTMSEIAIGPDSLELNFILDSVTLYPFPNPFRRVQHFSRLPSNISFCNFLPKTLTVIEGVGSTKSLISKNDFFCATDLGSSILRCFSDSSIDYNPEGLVCDTFDRIVSFLDLTNEFIIELYPNPVTEILHIRTSEWQSDIEVDILHLLGRKIATKKIINNEIIVSDLVKGTYFLRIHFGKQIIIKKFIKI